MIRRDLKLHIERFIKKNIGILVLFYQYQFFVLACISRRYTIISRKKKVCQPSVKEKRVLSVEKKRRYN
jgi:hypothetical protein